MSPYFIIPIFLVAAAIGFIGFEYGKSSTEVICQKHDEAQQQVTINAERGVITTLGKQQTISQGVDNAYHTGINAIDNLYGVQSSTSPASVSMPAVTHTASRFNGCSCKSSYYKLSQKECDANTAQLINLQNWVKQQENLK